MSILKEDHSHEIGHMCISKGEQTTALQENALASAQCEKTFRDVMSGAKEERPQFLEDARSSPVLATPLSSGDLTA